MKVDTKHYTKHCILAHVMRMCRLPKFSFQQKSSSGILHNEMGLRKF